ncbi:MAG: DUF2306 domain-containing protein, partial [Marinicellaceae bacterium]
MHKLFRLSVFALYSLLCFGVAGYAFYFLFQQINPHNDFMVKFSNAGLEVPAHFFGGGLALLLVPFQLSKKLRTYSIKTHRTIGMIYTMAVLFGSVSGFIMSFNATGGLIAEWGFRMLAILWFSTTFLAIKYAIAGNIVLHKIWIYRSIAFTSAAITLRIFLGLGLGYFHLPFLTVYVPTAWLCWLINV